MLEVLSAIGSVLGVIAVVYLAFLCTKWLGKRMNMPSQGKYMTVVDRIVIGQDKTILILRVGAKLSVVGVTQNGINHIADISEADLVEITAPKQDITFQEALKINLKKYTGIGANTKKQGEDEFE